MKSYLYRKVCASSVALLLVLGAALNSSLAHGMDRDVRSVIVASEYGLLAGTMVGAASVVFTQDVRSLFIGSSIGLYLGIVVGVYYVFNRDNPDNPLRYEAEPRSGLEPNSPYYLAAKPALEFKYPVIRF